MKKILFFFLLLSPIMLSCLVPTFASATSTSRTRMRKEARGRRRGKPPRLHKQPDQPKWIAQHYQILIVVGIIIGGGIIVLHFSQKRKPLNPQRHEELVAIMRQANSVLNRDILSIVALFVPSVEAYSYGVLEEVEVEPGKYQKQIVKKEMKTHPEGYYRHRRGGFRLLWEWEKDNLRIQSPLSDSVEFDVDGALVTFLARVPGVYRLEGRNERGSFEFMRKLSVFLHEAPPESPSGTEEEVLPPQRSIAVCYKGANDLDWDLTSLTVQVPRQCTFNHVVAVAFQNMPPADQEKFEDGWVIVNNGKREVDLLDMIDPETREVHLSKS